MTKKEKDSVIVVVAIPIFLYFVALIMKAITPEKTQFLTGFQFGLIVNFIVMMIVGSILRRSQNDY